MPHHHLQKKREKCRTRARLYLIVRQGASAEMLPTLLTTTPQRQCLLAMFTCLPTKIEMSLYVYITSAVLEKKKGAWPLAPFTQCLITQHVLYNPPYCGSWVYSGTLLWNQPPLLMQEINVFFRSLRTACSRVTPALIL